MATRLEKWERRLNAVLHTIDHELETRYAGRFTRHPSRPAAGSTSNPSHDGLFDVGAAFTAGFGSEHGRGYVVEARPATLERIPDGLREEVLEYVVRRLREELPRAFPGRDLRVERCAAVYKIVGDLRLD